MAESWVLFIARRFLRTRRREGSISTSLLSIIGIAVGVMALIVVLGVMNGFQVGTIQDILELSSFHVQIRRAGGRAQVLPESVQAALDEDPLVRHWFPFTDIQALVQGNFSDLQGMQIRGIDPRDFWQDEVLQDMITLRPGFPDFSRPGTIVLGNELARFLGVKTGDSISVVSISAADLDLRNPQEVTLEVAGTLESGYYQYDRNIALVSLQTMRDYLGWDSALSVGIKLRDRYQDRVFINRSEGLVSLLAKPGGTPEQTQILSWRQMNRAIFGALRVEKGIMFLLVSLIFLVVGVNIFQGLRRIIHERSLDIGMFKAMGARPRQIRRIFVLEGAAIGVLGSSAGTALGLLLGYHINTIVSGISALFGGGISPQMFFVTRIPVHIIPQEVVWVALFGLWSAVFAGLAASRSVLQINPLEALGRE
ncbi:ABC transporter permease [Spirochaeta lutea]|uniref:ABC transporter permease n=1 Tax=Spirochaeta lutea TaxID=1480694 RepID=A0A098QSK7_9SPIO|nr:ABC transporter permease [Spirochaeta lutea]KGE70739.1 hypothetical protein DC28_14655 [Spirochaeta lutea]